MRFAAGEVRAVSRHEISNSSVSGRAARDDHKGSLHLVVDNYGTHKTPEVEAWLAKHPRFKLHFIPTSSSLWLA